MSIVYWLLRRILPRRARYWFASAVDRHSDRCWVKMVCWAESDEPFPRKVDPHCIMDCIENNACYCLKFPHKWGLRFNDAGEFTYQGQPIHSAWSESIVQYRRGPKPGQQADIPAELWERKEQPR